ncbi:MAG: DUF438 domain-containing protein [Nitrospirota bacterium]
MQLGPGTKIDDLLSAYPFLLDFLLGQSPQFRLLQSSVMRKTVGKVATVSQAAAIGGIDPALLLRGIAAEIKDKTGESVAIAGDGAEAGGAASEKAPHSAAERQALLKEIIRDLHRGVDVAILKQRFHDLVKDVEPSDIAQMEQRLIEEGMPETEIKRLCDLHVDVFKASLDKKEPLLAPPGHPVHTFMLENRAAEDILHELTALLDKICTAGEEEFFAWYKGNLEELIHKLSRIDLHYLRKENQLFPLLEAHAIKGPTEVMWAIHDDIRDELKKAAAQLETLQARDALTTIKGLVKAIGDMIYKEEHILFPLAMKTLSDADWQRVRRGEEEIGYAWITPQEGWVSGDAAVAPPATAAAPGFLDLSVGRLTPEQADLILTHLPVELSFVDEHDEVRYYSQVKEKIFPRSPAVIGRKVQNCHPPKSLHMVQKIIDAFRAGTRDVADFWIEMNGRFVHIRYFAVRDAGGAYRGTLEVVQDATDIRTLTGQKRLLDWD